MRDRRQKEKSWAKTYDTQNPARKARRKLQLLQKKAARVEPEAEREAGREVEGEGEEKEEEK